ncbi:MAG: cystathionine gamma-synthase [Candidatus Raymondbacteria bacterium RifOxyA12_full_50_37]|uniref:Cystathionine gamma-synthase n=1 Tax=Candidatus Raymondbacteria bacterium RIFOXYD12_FULL_49_13 TaxID=1817890 RepID=A0A1F7FC59_UNCRA|nr:MAG: cystathionine gamma-synthase [Candidatus Raymondbacteria bacterium RifOxyA12_full_50_37]OGJ89023.1 MAG: cystathionine gamma-synthase [Candidatus Raymondbacteria bacterium RIFOXYA2_FULL_49_16]OGJ97050.1 MAG: cystathionine gamma-synthase [Candidatus Raymondbacteria bacterium RIFOXYC2_FULL_50_21]OGK04046.1 MAG: cystathionine gamma-synthase [Candidatus Raymondbacteria bacterium RIFOXYD12_FULL_49_13]OGP42011.1 MAG: cystathionine gamma-synthase [Candidatus Raymondbacteria bacterium RIFOXYB2_F
MKKNPQYGISTNAVHAGEIRYNEYGSITTPIVQTSTFIFKNTTEIRQLAQGAKNRFEYGRYGHPTQGAAERKLAALEGAEDAVLFSSGMSALTTALFALLNAGDHIILTDDAYRRTLDFCKTRLPKFNITCSIVKMGDYAAIKKAIRKNTRIFLSESPTNPYLNIMDLERLRAIFKGTDIIVISDSTFATPFNQRPLEWGVHLVVHSATKYLGGHNDLLAGVVLGNKKLTDPIRDYLKTTGGVIDPHSSYLLIRGLKTFELRMLRHNENGLAVARFLESHPAVRRAYYPGLASHPHHAIASAQMNGFGGVVTFEVKDDIRYVHAFLSKLKIINIGPSLGGAESLITHPASISYYDHSRAERKKLGIKDGLIRLAAGIENADDIIADLQNAFPSTR